MKTEGTTGEAGMWDPRRGMEYSAEGHAARGQEGENREEQVFTTRRQMGTPVRDIYLPNTKSEAWLEQVKDMGTEAVVSSPKKL